MHNRLFGTSGIRGNISRKVTPKLALELGLSIATYLNHNGTVAIGFDNRTSSDMLAKALVSGVLSGGCSTACLGLVPLPLLAYGTKVSGSKTGIMITASHNPPSDNGFKLFDFQGREYFPVQESAIEHSMKNQSFRSSDETGLIEKVYDIPRQYVATALGKTSHVSKPIKVILDCANGTSSNIMPSILSKIGCTTIAVNDNIDGAFPGRPSEPSPRNLLHTMEVIKGSNADIGFAYDGDADRVAVIDEKGNFVINDRIIALIAKQKLEENRSGTIVTSLDTSNCIDDIVIPLGGRIKRVKLGETHTYFGADESDVMLAAEPWKVIDPSWGMWADGIFTSMKIIEMLNSSRATVNDLLESIPNYPQTRLNFQCPDPFKPKAMSKITAQLSHERDVSEVWKFDGIRINYIDGSWMLFRPSGTEPKIRLYCEAKEIHRLKELVKKGKHLVSESLSYAMKK